MPRFLVSLCLGLVLTSLGGCWTWNLESEHQPQPPVSQSQDLQPNNPAMPVDQEANPGVNQDASQKAGQETEPQSQSQSQSQCRAVAPVPSGHCFARKTGTGLCQPQCIPYIRCRSGLSSCRLGNTSPVQLFNCEKQRNNTSRIPVPGSLLAIDVERKHNITTGHTLYVEEVCDQEDGSFKIRVSHSNYDRKCHLDENAWVIYNPGTMTANFISGEWKVWAKRIPVQGFILTGTQAMPAKPKMTEAKAPTPKTAPEENKQIKE